MSSEVEGKITAIVDTWMEANTRVQQGAPVGALLPGVPGLAA